MDSETNTAVIIDNNYYSIGFPNEKWDEIITRDNYISQIENYLDNDSNIIFIEGAEDSGKTTLNGIFARKNVTQTISVFFNPSNSLDFKREYLFANIVPQIKNLLNEEIKDSEYYDIEEYRHSIFQLRKKLKSNCKCIYFIIDGLESKINEDSEFVRDLFDFIPIGENIFKFLISGNAENFKNTCQKLKKQETKSISLSGLSTPEINKFLKINDISSNEYKELFKVTGGLPGRLKTLRRLLENENYSLDKINNTTTYKNWIELDCESVDNSKPIINGILSLISLNVRLFSLEEIANILSIPIDEATILIKNIRVLELNDGFVNFVSTEHKKFFANYLRGNKKQTEILLIQYLVNEKTINSKFELSKLYADREEWSKIIEMIDDSYLQSILEGTGALEKVNGSLELGVQASQKLNKYVKMWCYSIQGSIVNELDNFLFWESEIEAKISIKDFVGAITLAESAVLKVDRLRLLALIARRQKELNKNVDEDLINLISDLYKTTDLSSVGDKIYDIVADLIYAIPNLAVEMIEKSSGSASEKNINDWVIAKLSVAAINSSLKDDDGSDKAKKLEAVQSINNPSVRKINRAISFLVGNYSSSKVIDEVKKLSDSKEKLRLLRLWLNNNRSNNKDIELVINLALDELITSSSESTVTLDVLKDLSYQLPYIKDIETRRSTLNRFKTIENDLQESELSKNKYIYKLNIFHTVFTLNKHDSIESINKILKEIESIEDTLIKLESFSEVYSKLSIMMKQFDFTDKINFTYSRILSLSEELFISTANHYKISQYLLETISKKNPVLGLKICNNINTVVRRERSRLLILDAYLDNNLRYVNIDLLKKIEEAFEIKDSKNEAYLRILERYSEAKNLHFNTIQTLLYFIDKIDSYKEPSIKLKGYVLSYQIIVKNSTWKDRLSIKYESLIFNTWKKIEADWERVDKGFVVCSNLANVNDVLAKRIYDESIQTKEGSWIDSKSVAYTYFNSVKLIIRAYNGLLISENEKPNDFDVLEELINRIPSEIEKLKLWTEIGINSYMSNRIDISKKIYNSHVLPLVQGLFNKSLEIESALNSIILIHNFNSDLAIEYLQAASEEAREEAYSNICDFYISKRNPYEIYDRGENSKFNCSFDEVSKAINLISLLSTDSYIYNQISTISNALSNNKNNISKAQISTIVAKLKEIVKQKLPDTRNIKHQGYKIISNLKLAILNREKVEWEKIIEEAEKIPNLSDIIFVKAVILDNISSAKENVQPELRKKLVDDIINNLESFKVHYEYVQRVIDLTDTMYSVDKSRWKEVVNKAFNVSNNLKEGSEVYSSKRSIIDSMYRLDPSFAKELIKTIDKENKDNHVDKLVQDYFETLEMSNKIKNSKELEEKEKENYRIIVSGVYKALASLNSEKITTKKIGEISKYLPIGNKLPLHEVFPIYMYYLNNCARTYKTKNLTGAMSTLHRDNFIEAVSSSNLVHLLSQKRKLQAKSFRKFFIDEEFASNKPIKPNTREEAFNFIRKWMIDELDEFVFIVDSYTKKEDLEILKIIMEVNRDIEIDILGSLDGQKANIEEEYKNYWKKISDEIPPFVNITFCWNSEDNNNMPIHDRWIITKNSGLRLGTSINSLGNKRESEISVMKPNESLNILENTVKDYVYKRKKELNKQRLSYKSFSL
ncbi:hypothetical protein SDC9_55180 [bioreactor metagenome]|uniref:Uncharacterized protein n=1 Tax=bioreactor metagenome TaxID=1076179 RepID=A0A644X400_9ZZZZ